MALESIANRRVAAECVKVQLFSVTVGNEVGVRKIRGAEPAVPFGGLHNDGNCFRRIVLGLAIG